MKNFIEKIFDLNRYLKISIQILVDTILIIFSYLLSWYLRLDQSHFLSDHSTWVSISIIVPITLILFFTLSFYKNIIRFISLSFVKIAFIGTTISAFSIYLLSFSLDFFLPRSIPLIYLLILLTTICGIRIQLSFIYFFYLNKKRKRIGIMFPSKSGIKAANFLHQDTENYVIAFFDDKKTTIGSKISGIPVIDMNNIENVIKEKKIDILLLAKDEISEKLNENLLNFINKFKIEIKKVPKFKDFFDSYNTKSLKDISIQDILGRNPIKADPKLLDNDIKNKIVLITGAGGSIGRELCFQIIKRNPKTIIMFELSEFNLYQINNDLEKLKMEIKSNVKIFQILGSVQNEHEINSMFKKFKIDTIYHTAAYKHVPIIEKNIIEGIKNNIFGTKLIVEKTIVNNVKKFILISSDKAVRPTNIMGATKRVAEMICQSNANLKHKTIFSVVRFGNVIESSGSVIPLFRQQIKNGGPLTITSKSITRYFMTIKEASELVIQAGSLSSNGEIFILDMGKPVNIFELAKRMCYLNGLTPFYDDKKGDIELKIIGLRPGEKLYEELSKNRKRKKTSHSRIFSVDETIKDVNYINKILLQLKDACDNNELHKLKPLLKLLDDDFRFNKSEAY